MLPKPKKGAGLTRTALVPERYGDTAGSFASFLSCLVDQIMPPGDELAILAPQSSVSVSLSETEARSGECELKKIGMVMIGD